MTTSSDISRRELFRLSFLRSREDDPSRTGSTRVPTPSGGHSFPRCLPILRPPGAVAEGDFLDACTKCGDCISVCPHDAIIPAPGRFRHAAGTPMIDPAIQACFMCEDAPCIGACETGALRHDLPRKMGTARIDPFNCLAHQNTFCSVCVEQCPVEGAIEMREGRPVINEDVCTGCGVCQFVCPAPHNAVLIMPQRDRPNASVEVEGSP